MSITKEELKNTLRNIMKEESDYQAFFKAALEKAGKSIPSMSDEEKKAFFDKIDAAWNAKGEKNEALTDKQKQLDIDGDGEIEASDLAALRAGEEPKTESHDCGCGCGGVTEGGCQTNVTEGFYKSIMSNGGRNLFFAMVNDKTDDVKTIDAKTWLKSSMMDNASDVSKDRVIKAILKGQKQFNKAVEYNMWAKKNNPSFEEKMDYFFKNNFISNITNKGIKVYESVNEAIAVGKMVKVVDNPHWEAALGKKGPFKRKVKAIYDDNVFFTDGSNSSMKYVKESVNELASRTAVEIGGLTGMSRDFIQKFVDTHNLDIEKVFQFVKKGNLKDRMDFVTGLAGKPNNPYQTKLIKMFGESVNEDTKKRFEVDFYKGNGDRQTSHEEIIRGDKFSDVISQATKVAKSKGMNYVEFYYKDAFIGSIDRRNGYEFKKGRNSEKSPLSVNEVLKPKKLKDLKKGEKFTFGANTYTFIKLEPEISPNAANVKLSNGTTSVVSFGGGIVNINPKSGMGDYLKAGGRVWDNVNMSGNSVNEGKKRFNTKYGVGKSKYVVSYHDGNKKHNDGSDFFDVQIFKNQKDLDTFKKALLQKGFIEESVNEVGTNDWHYKAIKQLWDKAGDFTKKKVAALITKNPKATWDKIEKALRGSDYDDVTYYTDMLQIEAINEGRAFINAAKKAKAEGKTEFEFNGKTYPVTIKENLEEARLGKVSLLRQVEKGSTSQVEGVKISPELAFELRMFLERPIMARSRTGIAIDNSQMKDALKIMVDAGIEKRLSGGVKPEFKNLIAKYK